LINLSILIAGVFYIKKIKINNEVFELEKMVCGIASKDEKVGGSVESVTRNEN